MIYKIITFLGGEELKCPIEYSEKDIISHAEKLGKKVLSIRNSAIDTEEKRESKTIAYEVRLSFNEDGQNVTITKEELPMVLWAFLKDSKVVCMNGAFRGKDIISVLPNFNAMMGWNKGYQMNEEDFSLVNKNPVCLEARNYYNSVKELCHQSESPKELLEKLNQTLLN